MKVETVINPMCIGDFPIPSGYAKYNLEIKNCCGELAIAALLNIPVPKVFKKANIPIADLKKGTLQKKMKEIIRSFGFEVKQHGVKNKFSIPKCDLAIVRISFGNPKQHWIETAKKSHYLALKKFNGNHYILDNIKVDGGYAWIERTEYGKIIKNEKMFITSYLELKSVSDEQEKT